MTNTSVKQIGVRTATLDDILSTNSFSIYKRYHVFIGFLLFLAKVINPFTFENYIFAAEKVDYRCKNSPNTCDIRPVNASQHDNFNGQCYERVTVQSDLSCESVNNSRVVPCKDWTFEDPKSLVAEVSKHKKPDVRPVNASQHDNFNGQCCERVTVQSDLSCESVNNSRVVPCKEWTFEDPKSLVAEVSKHKKPDVRPVNASQHDNFNGQCYERVTVQSDLSCESVNNSRVVPCKEWTFEDPKSLVAEVSKHKKPDVRPVNSSQHDNFNGQCYERVTVRSDLSCESVNNSRVVPCKEWTFEDLKSLVAELHLECAEWKRTLIGTMHSFGYMMGLLIIGPISDKIGRKKVLVTTAVMGGTLGMARSFVSNYWIYISLETVEGAIGDSCSPSFMLVMEIVAAKNRPRYYMWVKLGHQLGRFLLALASWQFPYWRHLLRVIYAPLLLLVFYSFLIDESPRWLLTKGRKDEAVFILQKAAKINKITLDKAVLDNLTCELEEKSADMGFRQLLRNTFASKVLFQRFLVCIVWWTTSTFVNYGIKINSVLLSGNKYINYVLLVLMEVPASIYVGYTLIYFKRKKPLIISFCSAAIFFSIQPFLPKGITWLSIIFLMLGKFMSSIYFGITYVYTSELFPTHTRNSMHGLCSSIGRIGSMLAPQTPLLIPIWSGLPSMLFSGMSLFAALVTCLVPDTAGDALPDTVHQAETVGRGAEDKIQMDTVHHANSADRNNTN